LPPRHKSTAYYAAPALNNALLQIAGDLFRAPIRALSERSQSLREMMAAQKTAAEMRDAILIL
jgi:hypothetical protein